MKTVGIVDYGLCNLHSVTRAVEECGARALVAREPRVLDTVTHIILPGVGAFSEAMANLRERELDSALRTQVLDHGVPFLGICLGMQLMASRGSESGNTAGLDLIRGHVEKLAPAPGERLPHVGWNEVHQVRDCPLFRQIPSAKDFYFIHSYHLCCDEPCVAARTPFGGQFTSVVAHGTRFGTQFHPEKSQHLGLRLLRNFLQI